MLATRTYGHSPRLRQPNFRYSESHAPSIDRSAPDDVRDLWTESYEVANDYYTQEKAPSPDNLSRNTAWKTVKMFWEQPRRGQYRARNPRAPVIAGTYRGQALPIGKQQPIPPPQETATLCKLVELTWIAEDGNLQVQRFQEPGLPDVFWNRRTKILYMFPGTPLDAGQCVTVPQTPSRMPRVLRNLVGFFAPLEGGDDTFIGLKDQVGMYKIWTNGRQPTCRHEITISGKPIMAYGVADTIVYRSDKWDKKPNPHPDKVGSQEYLHQFGLDVAVEETGGDPPPQIVIRGGKLDVLEGGIAY